MPAAGDFSIGEFTILEYSHVKGSSMTENFCIHQNPVDFGIVFAQDNADH